MSVFKKTLTGLLALVMAGTFTSCKFEFPGSDTKNHAPKIVSQTMSEINEGVEGTHQIVAQDKDNDTLKYFLQNHPDWVSVNANTGELSYKAPLVNTDTDFGFRVGVSDGTDTVYQNWNTTVKDLGNNDSNLPPTAKIERDFGDGTSGKVDYRITGEDSDGTVEKVSISANGGDFYDYMNPVDNNKIVLEGQENIQQGNNTLEARVFDNKGDSSSDTSSFYSPTEAEARAKIEEILDKRSEEYDRYVSDSYVFANCSDTTKKIYVDYELLKNDGKSIIINYVGYGDDLDEEQTNKNILDCVNKPNFYNARGPFENLESGLNNFLDNNF